jgi:hypothetical protein
MLVSLSLVWFLARIPLDGVAACGLRRCMSDVTAAQRMPPGIERERRFRASDGAA